MRQIKVDTIRARTSTITFLDATGAQIFQLSGSSFTYGPSTGSSIEHTFQSGADTYVAAKSVSNGLAGFEFYNASTLAWTLVNLGTAAANTLQFKNASATVVGSLVQGGAWTFGSLSTASSSGPVHKLSGGLWASFSGTGDSDGIMFIGTNAKISTYNGAQARTVATYGGGAILFQNTTTGLAAIEFWTNTAGDLTSTAATRKGFVTDAGAWTFGPTTPGSIYHTFRGNISISAANGDKGIGQNCFFDSNRDWGRTSATASGTAISFAPNTSGTAMYVYLNVPGDTLSTPATTVATLSTAGAWAFGPSSSDAIVHSFNGSLSFGSQIASFSSATNRYIGSKYGFMFIPQAGTTSTGARIWTGAYFDGTSSKRTNANQTAVRLIMNTVSPASNVAFQIDADPSVSHAADSAASFTPILTGTADGSWVVGPSSAGATLQHAIYGHLQIGTSAGSISVNSTNFRIFGNKFNSILFADAYTASVTEFLTGQYTADASTYRRPRANKGGIRVVLADSAASTDKILQVFSGDISGVLDSGVVNTEIMNAKQSGSWTLGPAGGLGGATPGLTVQGGNLVGGTNAGDGAIRLGNNTGYGVALQFSDVSSTTFYIDSLYNGDAAKIQFRMKTASTPVLVGDVVGTGSWTWGPTTYAALHTMNGQLTVNAPASGASGINIKSSAALGATDSIELAMYNGASNFAAGFGVARTTSTVGAVGVGYIRLREDNTTTFGHLWVDSSHRLRIATNFNDVGSNTNGVVVGDQTAVSDARLKTDIKPISYGLDDLMKVSFVEYRLLAEPDRKKLGIVAQNTRPLIPEVILETTLDQGDVKNILMVEYYQLIAVLGRSLQELCEELRSQKMSYEDRLATLSSRLDALENRL
jgi:hypothetical protein